MLRRTYSETCSVANVLGVNNVELPIKIIVGRQPRADLICRRSLAAASCLDRACYVKER